MLLAHIPDPFALASETTRTDRRRLAHLLPLADRNHSGWDLLSDDGHRRGVAALEALCADPHH